MKMKPNKKETHTKRAKKKDILKEINSDEARNILMILIEKDKKISAIVKQIAKQVLSSVDVDKVANDIYFDLNNIAVEDVWDNSGGTREGYVEPDELAGEMFEEALDQFLEELKRYQDLSMHTEAKIVCMGILKGLHKFKKESTTGFRDYVEDAPQEYAEIVFDSWKKGSKNSKDKKEIEDFMKKCGFQKNY